LKIIMTAIKININGIVQGVGFRPFIYRLAKKHHLAGWVLNSSRGVEIHAQGRPDSLDQFLSDIKSELPTQALIDELIASPAEPAECRDFAIRESQNSDGVTRISPDIALCSDCLAEMLDKNDRRFLYPFINCTNCGPRFSIIEKTPYDRPLTTMAGFAMCPGCQKEYDDPGNRRFHAQPNACPVCGPRVWLTDQTGKELAEKSQAMTRAAELLASGGILAIKGIGGFHLACDAGNDAAVKKLRDRKNRPDKPLALMCRSLEDARSICQVRGQEEKVLGSSQAPIVLLPKSKIKNQKSKTISELVARENNYLGVMLPYAPVHHLLFRELNKINPELKALVMTSGNVQDEPVVTGNREALSRLAGLADHFLLNDRDIENRNDDSIVFVDNHENQKSKIKNQKTSDIRPVVQIVRHSRGYAPNPINLPVSVPPSLAVGGEMKNVFCLASGSRAYLSQYIGEMDNNATLDFFAEMIEKYQKWFRIKPEVIVHDLHPDHLTTRWAKEQSGVSLRAAQHHKAHILSALADNGKIIPAIGVAFDGTGYGEDGKIWGGEFFLFDGKTIDRAGHLEYLPLPGGEASIKRPYRIAAAYGKHLTGGIPQSLQTEDNQQELEVISKQLEGSFNLAWTSSLGRLFDAVSALLGVCQVITFEAQAAMALENCLDPCITGRYDHQIIQSDGQSIVLLKEMWRQLTDDAKNGVAPGVCSAKFHNTIVDFTLAMCDNLKLRSGIKTVALSGGVFQNRTLLNRVRQGLLQKDYQVLIHRQVPSNDGGIALGQILSSIINR
jgi:hydrogenase maturation protein HypF